MSPGCSQGQQQPSQEFVPTRLSILGRDKLSVLEDKDNQRILSPNVDICFFVMNLTPQ